ncbi:hypothetical protein F4604DRAFT_1916559 [Suillus subluteus]|nr:hypothetical protein F4604DRAFT_1916559 [Suillus subluteus]
MPSPPPRTAPPPVDNPEHKENVVTPTVHSVPLPADTKDEMLLEKPNLPNPNIDVDDETMSDNSPPRYNPTPNPPITNTLNPSSLEEDILHAHLVVAETNRSIIKSNSINSLAVVPQFIPAPVGGFPCIHLAHAAQLFDFQAAKVIAAWLKVPNLKVLIRVFDHDGKNPLVKGPILVEHLCKAITNIALFVHQDNQEVKVSPPYPEAVREETELPLSFLAYNLSEETTNLILEQQIWSSTEITFAAYPFQVNPPPHLLFCL